MAWRLAELEQRSWSVLVACPALWTEWKAVGGIGFEVEGAEPTANPVLVGLCDLPAPGNFVADPDNHNSRQKDE